MSVNKKILWEQKFSDNFRPGLFEKFVKKFELSRVDAINEIIDSDSDVVVDIACGDGVTLQKVSSKFNKVIGLDIATNRIESAREKFRRLGVTGSEFKVCDIDKGIPLKDGMCDYVVCEASFGYFYDLDFVLTEIYRILKKNGKFIVQVPNYAFLLRRIALMFGQMPKTSSFPGTGDGGALHYFTYASLNELLLENKFKVSKISSSGVMASIRKFYPSLLAPDIIYLCTKLK